MNCLDKQVSVQSGSKWFTFKPNEIKMFHNPEIARFISQAKGEEGLVEISDSIMELEPTDASRVEYMSERRREGINKRIKKLDWQKHNLLAALRLDLEIKGLKVDPLILASKGDVEAIKELNKLTGDVQRAELSNADIIRKELGIDGISSTNVGAVDQGRPNPTQSTKAGK